MILSMRLSEQGELLEEVVQNEDGSVDVINYENGIEVRRERTVQAYPPLDAVGRMATLSAILHNDPEDWSNASGIPVAHLIAEAEAWSLGGQ